MLSIDQNCHSLWDALPKLQALTRQGHAVSHFIEDVDVAFTSLGRRADGPLRLEQERFHHSGSADWGAALFYSEFLGRQPVELRDWEELLGTKLGVAARGLGRTLESLYDEFSVGDNWQLVGRSYVGDQAHHRIIADLSARETAPFLREMLKLARADMLERFVEPDARRRVQDWCTGEAALLEELLARHAGSSLAAIYHDWLGRYLGDSVRLDTTSSLFALRDGNSRLDLLEAFLSDYDRLAGLYNQAIAETHSRLHPLATQLGELPFFAVFQHQVHRVRAPVFRQHGRLRVGEREFRLRPDGRLPVDELRAGGISCLAGKALLLAIQVRTGREGDALVLPYRGSAYMPTSERLAALLVRAGLLPGRLHPIVRVRFRLLDRMRSSSTTIRLPRHLAKAFGREEIAARKLAEDWAEVSAEAARRLAILRDPHGRQHWQRDNLTELARRIADLDRHRRDLAAIDPKLPELRELWRQVKPLGVQMLDATLRQIDRDWQVGNLDYWDSRGAILPWSIALGGEGFYNEIIAGAEVRQEPFVPSTDHEQASHP